MLASPQAEGLLEPVLVAPLAQEPLELVFVETLPGALRRALEEEESVSLSLRKLLLNAFADLGSFPLKCLFPLLPFWSRSKWWSVYSHHAFELLYRAPPSTLADTAGVSSTLLPLCHDLPLWSFCRKFVVRAFPGPLPSWGRRYVLTIPEEGFSYALGRRLPPPTPTRSRGLPFGTWGALDY